MMADRWDLLRWIGLEPSPDDPQVLDAISRTLEGMEPSRARYVAAFSYLLGRVAGADLQIVDAERSLMTALIAEEAGLTQPEAATVVALALGEVRRFSGTHNFMVTREFVSLTTHAQRMGLLRCLFALAAVDDSVDTREENEIRGVSRELHLEHGDFVRAKMDVRKRLAVLKSPRQDPRV